MKCKKLFNCQPLLLGAIVVLTLLSCSCRRFLEATPDKTLTIPSTADDLRAILDNSLRMNQYYSFYGSLASDDYYLTNTVYNSVASNTYALYYIWGQDGEPTNLNNDWFAAYKRISCANTVLEYLDKVKLEEKSESDLKIMQGEALFYRGWTNFQLTQIYALPYNPETSSKLMGVPLRLTTDITVEADRPSLEKDFQQIREDLKKSVGLLPEKNSSLLRPSRVASYAALAKVALVMQDFSNAIKYADSSLNFQSSLLDFNDIDENMDIPFPIFNKETIWYADVAPNAIISPKNAQVDTTFYRSYESDDLRKNLFFKIDGGTTSFKGTYNGGAGISTLFGGFAVDEIYLIKAESEARLGKIQDAITTINIFCKNRLNKDMFAPFQTENQQEALDFILDMRRKELCFRGINRWVDIRRLNELPGKEIILQRAINGKVYELKPHDLHYAFLIPDAAIDYGDYMQNER